MKKNFYSIMVLMSISLIGISWIQWYWIQHAIQVREQQFDQSVRYALANITDKLETQEVYLEMQNWTSKNKLRFPEHIEIEGKAIKENMSHFFELKEDLQHISIDTVFNFPNDLQFRYLQKSITNTASDSIHENFIMIIDSADTNDLQIELIEEMLVDSDEEIEAASKQLNSLDKIFSRIVFEITEEPRDINKRLEGINIEKIIQNTLKDRGIDAKFIYIIQDYNGDLLPDTKENIFNEAELSSFQINLFPNDISPTSAKLSLFFPDKKSHVVQSMWVMLLLSFLFTLTIVFSFAASIRMMLRQKKISEIKTDFINNMTHEFKTPIATISLATDAIRHPKTKDDAGKIDYYTDIISNENKRMHQQVEQVLRMALLEKDKLEFHFEQTDLHEIINKACDVLTLQIQQKNGQITKQLMAENDTISADPIHLQNLICNLIENSIKYSNDSPDILITTSTDTKNIILSIADKGIGMSKETLKHIFDSFYRKNTGNLHDVKGFGLGLSYVKAIADMHNADISVSSEVHKGTTVYVKFPYNQS